MLQDGIGRSPEEEEPVDPAAAREFVRDPARLLAHASPLIDKLKRQGAGQGWGGGQEQQGGVADRVGWLAGWLEGNRSSE